MSTYPTLPGHMVWSWAWPAVVAGAAGSGYFSKGCAQPLDTVGACKGMIDVSSEDG